MTPATPAAAWVCPMFDFTEPSQQRLSARPVLAVGGQQRLRLDRVAERGAGAVRLDHVDLGRPAARRLASACRITRCWDGPFGAVRPLDAPSWFTALPRTTARTGCPWRRASDSRSTSSTPAPSAQPVPSAAAANALHRPSAARPAAALNSTNAAGRGHHRHAAGQRQRALARAQRLAGQVQRHQRGGAGGVHRARPGPRGRRCRRSGRRSRWPRSRCPHGPRVPRRRR